MSSHEHSEEDSTDKIKFDFSKVKKIFNPKVINVLVLILFILIPVILTAYVRLQSENLVATEGWARSSVENYYKNQIAQSVNAQYPNLPTAQRTQLIDKQYLEFQKTNKDQIDAQVVQTAAYFKTGFQYQENNNTYTFLGDLDSYYYLRQARNLEEKGTLCDEIREGKCVDTHILAPLGGEAGKYLHPYGIVYTYKILHFFNSKINLMQASFYLPILLAMVAAIAAFFIGRKLMNNTAGFFAAMFIALNPLFISRTAGSDTDIWNIMFPLLIIWAVLEVFDSKKLWKKIALTTLTGFLLGAFSFAWVGWWYIFDFILAALIGYLIFEIIKEYIKNKKITKVATKEIKDIGIIIGVLILSTIIFVSLFTGWISFVGAFTSPLHLQGNLKSAAHADLWPNVFTTVAELNEANIPTIISQITSGMNILFPLALLGILFTLVKRKPDLKEYLIIGASIIVYFALISTSAMNLNPIVYLLILMIPVAIVVLMLLREESTVDVKMAFLLTIWFVGMIYASIKGVRFILLLIPAFSIAAGVAIGYIYQYFDRIFHQDLKIPEMISKAGVFLLLCLILIAPIQMGKSAGASYMPSMTAGWWDSLSKIRQESKPDAIINSWWDFGHWFKYVADRRVSLDGVTQNHPNAHWLGLALQADDPSRSIAVLRMLDCGSNNAFVEIDKRNNDTEISENIVSEIIMMSKENARKDLLAKGYTTQEIDTILSYTHCNPPDDYFITSEDMVGKAGVWAHFGLWDFDRAFVINNVKPLSVDKGVALLQKQFNYTTEESERIYYDVQALTTDREMNDWISAWPSYATSNMLACSNLSEMVLCDLNIGIGGNAQQNYVIQRAVINLTSPKTSQILVGVYDKTSNAKLGESITAFDQIVIADKELKKYKVDNASIGLSMLLDVQENNNVTTYRALVSDPALIESTFTKLFYLDGKYAPQFEKFSDMTDITGTRIIIWKVKWN